MLSYVKGLLSYTWRHYPLFFLSLIVGLGSSCIELLGMVLLHPLMSIATNGALPDNSFFSEGLRYLGMQPSFTLLLQLFCMAFTLRLLTYLLSQGLYLYYSRRIQKDLMMAVMETVVTHQPLKTLQSQSSGYYLSLTTEEAYRAQLLLMQMAQFVNTSSLALLYYLAIFHYSTLAGGIISGFLVVVFIGLLPVLWQLYRVGRWQVDYGREAVSYFADVFNGVRTVRGLQAESYVVRLYDRIVGLFTFSWFKTDFLLQVAKTAPIIFLLMLSTALLSTGNLALSNAASLTSYVTILFFLVRFFPVLGQSFTTLMRCVSEIKSGHSLMDILAAKESAQRESTESEAPALEAIDQVVFQNVAFAYDDKRPLIAHCDWRFEKGHRYAIVGPSGSGKSSLADCLLGFYDATEGDITVNGVPIARFDSHQVRSKIVLVSQKTTIFNTSLRENITFGRHASDEHILAILALVQLQELLDSLPNGLDTIIDYQGSNLSGGQLQRIGLARALVTEPDMLLLDESTSALDKDTQARVMSALLKRYAEKILVFITHDPLVIADADIVYDISSISPKPVVAAEPVLTD